MGFKIILSLLFGFLIGIEIQNKSNLDTNKLNEDLIKSYDDLIKAQNDHIKFYGEYVEYLEGDYITGYKDALNETLKENINLKKKLKAYE